jgi:hypothetical protein
MVQTQHRSSNVNGSLTMGDPRIERAIQRARRMTQMTPLLIGSKQPGGNAACSQPLGHFKEITSHGC